MVSTKNVVLNQSQNAELELPCIKCLGKTTHKVLVSVNVRGEQADGDWSLQWCDDYQIVECSGCKSKSFRNVSSNSCVNR